MDNNVLGRRIRNLREEKMLSQLDFSKKINIGNTTLSQYENGQRTPSDEVKQKIADFFGVSVDYLLGRTELRSSQESRVETKAFHTRDLSGLPEEAVKQIDDYIELIKLKYNPDGSLKRK